MSLYNLFKKYILFIILHRIIGVQHDFLIMDGSVTLLSHVASRSVLIICYTTILLITTFKKTNKTKHPTNYQYDGWSPLGLLEAKSMLKSIKQEGNYTSMTQITWNTFQVLHFVAFSNRDGASRRH